MGVKHMLQNQINHLRELNTITLCGVKISITENVDYYLFDKWNAYYTDYLEFINGNKSQRDYKNCDLMVLNAVVEYLQLFIDKIISEQSVYGL